MFDINILEKLFEDEKKIETLNIFFSVFQIPVNTFTDGILKSGTC